MNKQLTRFIFLLSCIAFGCSDESQLQQSIYVDDPDNPGLPEYSELGYNTFGAYYDRLAFTSSEVVPVKVMVTEGVTSFVLSGQMDYEDMSITFTMADITPDEYADLIALHDASLDLTDEDYTVVINESGIETEAEILNGTLHFKRAQHLLVDKQLTGIVLSGTFEFQALIDGEPITISSGRFDVSVGENNFYFY